MGFLCGSIVDVMAKFSQTSELLQCRVDRNRKTLTIVKKRML